jgi:hypothetical protein
MSPLVGWSRSACAQGLLPPARHGLGHAQPLDAPLGAAVRLCALGAGALPGHPRGSLGKHQHQQQFRAEQPFGGGGIELPWSQFTSECRRWRHPPRLTNRLFGCVRFTTPAGTTVATRWRARRTCPSAARRAHMPSIESFPRVDWVAVPKALRARRANRRTSTPPWGCASGVPY